MQLKESQKEGEIEGEGELEGGGTYNFSCLAAAVPRAGVPLGGGGGRQGGDPALLLLPGLDTLELLWIPNSGFTTVPDKEGVIHFIQGFIQDIEKDS